MDSLESNLTHINIPQKTNSEVSDFINAEKSSSSDLPVTSDIPNNLTNSKQNDEEEICQPAEESEPEEPTFQDILGSGDLMKKIIKQGTPDDRPMKGEQILINLVGRLEENNEVVEDQKSVEITLGDCEVQQ